MEIKFKAGRRAASSCEDYREIIKSGDLHHDQADTSDDVISVRLKEGRLIIDCDKKTGEFRLVVTDESLRD